MFNNINNSTSRHTPSNTQQAAASNNSSASRTNRLNTPERIDQLCLSGSRRSPQAIMDMINRAVVHTYQTDQDPQDNMPASAMFFNTQYPAQGLCSVESYVDLQNRTQTIIGSYRVLAEGQAQSTPQASDLSLAHLLSAQRSNPATQGSAPTLPESIVRHKITNEEAANLIVDLSHRYPVNNNTFRIQINRQQPDDPANTDLRAVLGTANGKSTAYMVSDFNTVNNTAHTIEGVDISLNPAAMRFHISQSE